VIRAPFLALIACLIGPATWAQAEPSAPTSQSAQPPERLAGWRDPQDGRLDVSEWLLDRKGVLPVPLIVTEPAIGFGGGALGLYFRDSLRERREKAAESGRLEPPDIYALGAFGTENGTRGAAGGGMVTSENGRWRWRGGVARMDVNLDFYGVGGRDRPLGLNLQGWASVQHAMMRLGQSDAWLVARWNYFDLRNRFDVENPAVAAGALDRASRSSGLGVSLEFDSRDTIFTASRGMKGGVDLTSYAPGLGNEHSFQTYRAYGFGYWPVAPMLVLGGRADARSSGGVVPFYLLPFIEMRGVPLMRLQDKSTALVETEVRWNLDPRWAVVGFMGAGRAWGTRTSFSEGTGTVTKGAGVRYLLARRLGMYVGVDAARSTQDHGWYIQVGSAWR
jgi:hypothetical protein